ncbi:Mandelate racemase/muconate lactonizing protein [Alicyclobacillus hesperidum URH17-3-68]|nr:Mandelate racemase/muconate lactonizing protein [Alicyclobacillus hesperidum URH17-3-68]
MVYQEGIDNMIASCTFRRLEIPLVEPMRTAYGEHRMKTAILIELQSDGGAMGVAECVAMREPTYTEESVATAWHVIRHHLLPRLARAQRQKRLEPDTLTEIWSDIRGNKMAQAAVEMAFWDLWSMEHDTSMTKLIGGVYEEINVGISIGIQVSMEKLLLRVERALQEGYRRIKLKISPEADRDPLLAIRKAFPDVALMADANSAYRLDQMDRLLELDRLALMMIEQPLAYDDMVDHAELQARLQTSICLDESIRSAEDVRRAAKIGACRIVNIKPGRLGGIGEVIRAHQVAQQYKIGLWCGGMYETGVGRLHNLAVCALPGMVFPTDTGPSDRYFEHDILKEPIRFEKPGILRVRQTHGVAEWIDWEVVDAFTTDKLVVQLRDL